MSDQITITIRANEYEEGRNDLDVEKLRLKEHGPEVSLEGQGYLDYTWPGEGDIKRIPHSGQYDVLVWSLQTDTDRGIDRVVSKPVKIYVKLIGFGARDTDPHKPKPPMTVAQRKAIEAKGVGQTKGEENYQPERPLTDEELKERGLL